MNTVASLPAKLLPCPFCGSAASLSHSNDPNGCYWAKVRCDGCGVESRGKWAATRSDACPMFYAEVREEWNRRASPAPSAGVGVEARVRGIIALLRQPEPDNGEKHTEHDEGYEQASSEIADMLEAALQHPAAPSVSPAVGGPDLGLVAEMLDDLIYSDEFGTKAIGQYTVEAIREQARLCREADNATGEAVTVNRSGGGLDDAAVAAGHLNFNSMTQCANSWLAVNYLLHELVPDWTNNSLTGREAALTAIRRLATAEQPAIDLDACVDRFLGWKLPDDFGPDDGISFIPPKWPNTWPIGTNLLTAAQARAMLEYVLNWTAGAPSAQQPLDGPANNAGVATGSRNGPPSESVTRGNPPSTLEQPGSAVQVVGEVRILDGSISSTSMMTSLPDGGYDVIPQGSAAQGEREPFRVGNIYRAQSGELARFVAVHNAGTSYETMSDETGVHRYTSRDFGRVTGSAHDYSDPRNTPPLYTTQPPAPAAEQGEEDCMNETIGELLAKGFKVTIEPDDDVTQPEARGVEGMVLVPRADLQHAAETCDSWLAMHREYVRVADIERWEYPPGVEGLAESLRAILAAPNPVRAEQPEVQGTWKASFQRDARDYVIALHALADSQPGTVIAGVVALLDDIAKLPDPFASAPGAGVGVDEVRKLADYLGKRGGPLQSYNREAQERIAREYLTAAFAHKAQEESND